MPLNLCFLCQPEEVVQEERSCPIREEVHDCSAKMIKRHLKRPEKWYFLEDYTPAHPIAVMNREDTEELSRLHGVGGEQAGAYTEPDKQAKAAAPTPSCHAARGRPSPATECAAARAARAS